MLVAYAWQWWGSGHSASFFLFVSLSFLMFISLLEINIYMHLRLSLVVVVGSFYMCCLPKSSNGGEVGTLLLFLSPFSFFSHSFLSL